MLLAAVLLSLAACSGYAGKNDEAAVSFEAMDTYMTITVYGNDAEEAAAAAQEETERLDSVLSAEEEGSEVYELNLSGSGEVSEDIAYLIEASIALWQETDGAFDITIYPVTQLWGFTTGEYAVPSDEELSQALLLVGTDKLIWDPETSLLTMEDGMSVGFGAIAKGYCGERLSDIFDGYDITGAIASLGGNIVTYGSKPDGSAWNIAIQDPEDSSEYIVTLSIEGSTNIVTSGGYERYFEEDGETYHHIIDPETGYPADEGLLSVSIISADGTTADGLSTALFVLGTDEAIEFWRNSEYEFEMVLVDEDRNVYITEGLKDSYSCSESVTVIEK